MAIFEDGEVVGPDLDGAADRIAAAIDAEQDLAETVRAGVGPNKDRAQLWATMREAAKNRGLGRVVMPRVRNHSLVSGRVPHEPRDFEQYSAKYSAARRDFAEELSNAREKAGDSVQLISLGGLHSIQVFGGISENPLK